MASLRARFECPACVLAVTPTEAIARWCRKPIATGRAEGRVEGRAEGRAEALLAVLEARGLRVSDEARARVVACSDVAQLDVWVRKAVSVASVDELF